MNECVLQASGLGKTFTLGTQVLTVFAQLNLQVQRGQSIAIMGSSGAGKSTLLQLLGGLDQASSGQVNVLGHDLAQLSERARCRLRNQHLGFVYQFHHLLPELSALENVCMPLLIRGMAPAPAKQQARAQLAQLGLADRVQHKPAELSGGERQRTAIARALVGQPTCVLADEPTGNLDSKTAEQVADVLLKQVRDAQSSLVLVTHDTRLAERMGVVLHLENGSLLS